MKILFPLLNGTQLNKELLEKVLKQADSVVLLLVIDAVDLENKPFGFAANDITDGNALMAEISPALKNAGVEVSELLEWGDTLEKIDVVSRRESCEKIIFQKQNSKHFFDLVQKLTNLSSLEIELIENQANENENSKNGFENQESSNNDSENNSEKGFESQENDFENNSENNQQNDFGNNAGENNNSEKSSENNSNKNNFENNNPKNYFEGNPDFIIHKLILLKKCFLI